MAVKSQTSFFYHASFTQNTHTFVPFSEIKLSVFYQSFIYTFAQHVYVLLKWLVNAENVTVLCKM